MKKLLLILSALIMAVSCFTVTGFAADTEYDLYSTYTWSVDGDGTFTIGSTEEGALFDMDSEDAPWHSYIGSIKKIVISGSISSVYRGAFEGFTAAESIIVGDSVEELESSALCPGESLRTVAIGSGVKSIEDGAFETAGLVSITVDDDNPCYCDADGVLYTKDMTELICYPACKADTSYTVPDTVVTMKDFAFYGCQNLRELTLPDGIETVSFFCCGSLTDIVIPDNVKEIGKQTFEECNSLKAITLGKGIEEIYYGAFAIPNLTDITVDSENPYFCDEDGVLFNKDKTEIICHPGARSETEYVIPVGVVSVGGYAFYGCDNLKNVSIPEGVKYICQDAFAHCDNLTEVVIPDGVINIGEAAFAVCTGLTDIELPDSLEYIGGDAFNNCRSIKELSFPDGIISLEDGVCECCYSLESVKLPANLRMMGWRCFYICKSLKSIVIPDGVTHIPDYAFSGTALESITIPKLDSVNGTAFDGCSHLKDVYYAGSAADRALMEVPAGRGTYYFRNANWHYNYGSLPAAADSVSTGIQSVFSGLSDGLSYIVFFIKSIMSTVLYNIFHI